MEMLKGIEDLKSLRTLLSREIFKPDKDRVRICCGTACTATGSGGVVKVFEKEISKKGLYLEIVKTGCQGLCQKGPVMKAEPYGYFYPTVKPDNVKEIISNTY